MYEVKKVKIDLAKLITLRDKAAAKLKLITNQFEKTMVKAIDKQTAIVNDLQSKIDMAQKVLDVVKDSASPVLESEEKPEEKSETVAVEVKNAKKTRKKTDGVGG